MNRADFLSRLRSLHACHEALRWAEATPGTPAQLWEQCNRADWLLWLARKANVERPLMVRAACACAETALVYVRPDAQLACLWAIDSARRWSRGETDEQECQAAAYAAADAADAYADAAAADAYADAAAAYAAYAAAYAAYAADAAAAYAYAYAADARSRALAVMAPLVRREIPWSVIKRSLASV